MNSLVKSFLEVHKKEYEIDYDTPKAFEHLINYITTRNYTSRHFDPNDISLGEGEVGIDGLAIIVNDTIVTEFSQIEDFFSNPNEISVTFIFTQAKTSESISLEALSHFFNITNDFLQKANVNMNSKAAELHKICRYIMKNPTKLTKNPDIHMFFAFTGVDNDNDVRQSVVTNQIEYLTQKSLFDDITFNLYDANKIVNICRSIKGSMKKSIEMVDCAVMPKIHNVSEAYIGIAKCKDYIELISNDEGAIISNLFEDNIRYFQGQNNVNAEIQSTLRAPEKQQEFSILNNGVTIVASEMRRTGNTFTLSNFQIINGCQTSFILYENRNRISDDAFVVVKLIATTDKDISDSIVKTTNRQTPVLNEAFETLRDFHKNLEDTYSIYPPPYRLYYERRSKQYDSTDINKNKIVSFPFQTTAYISVFLGEPQSTHRYYGELLKSYSKRIYNDQDVLEQYCIASLYVFLVDKFIREHSDFAEWKSYRFHIAFMLRCIATNVDLPRSNSREMKKLCEELFNKITDEKWKEHNITLVCNIIQDIIKNKEVVEKDGNQLTRSKEFTNKLLEKIKKENNIVHKELKALKKGVKVRCKVISWNSSFAYVNLIDYKEAGSIHIKYIANHYVNDIGDVLSLGQEIEATIIDDIPHLNFGYNLSIID